MAFFNSNPSNRWPNGIVPYEITEADFNNDQIRTIQEAIDHWNDNTIMRLIARTTQDDYVVFVVADDSCSSSVGRVFGPQNIGCDVGDGFGTGSVIHEIGHAIGMYHEHTRPDRDSFVEINEDNIEEDKLHNFDIRTSGYMLSPYDYGSIMHYGRRGFAIDNSQNTITPIPDSSVNIGQRDGLSSLDIMGVCVHYNVPHFGVVWQDDQDNNGANNIHWAALSNWGKKCSGIQRVNSSSNGNQIRPAIGMDQMGNSVMVWQDSPDNNSDFRIRARGLRMDGVERFSEFTVNDSNYGTHIQPHISVMSDGDFLVTWVQSWDGGRRIMSKCFDPLGRVVLPDFEVTPGVQGVVGLPVIGHSSNRHFVVAWGELFEESLSVYAKGFNSDGTTRFDTITVASGLGDLEVHPQMAMSPNGNFVLVWEDDFTEIKARGFDLDGNERFGEITVNVVERGRQFLSDVALYADGRFLVVWTDDSNQNNLGQIYLRGFNSNSTQYLSTRTVNSRGGGEQWRPRIAIAPDDSYFVVWADDRDRNGFFQVHSSGYNPDHSKGLTAFTVNEEWDGQQWYPAVAAR